jgi:hypothetical protein
MKTLPWANAAVLCSVPIVVLGMTPFLWADVSENRGWGGGSVFSHGPEFDKKFAEMALNDFQALKPNPAWVAKLKALSDNTWLYCDPPRPQPEGGRAEVPMVFMPDFHAFMFCCGCTDPGYSSDTWLYHTGANRWVQMQANFITGERAKTLNKGPFPTNRPGSRCSLGLTYDSDRKRIVEHGAAGAGHSGYVTWDYDPASNSGNMPLLRRREPSATLRARTWRLFPSLVSWKYPGSMTNRPRHGFSNLRRKSGPNWPRKALLPSSPGAHSRYGHLVRTV